MAKCHYPPFANQHPGIKALGQLCHSTAHFGHQCRLGARPTHRHRERGVARRGRKPGQPAPNRFSHTAWHAPSTQPVMACCQNLGDIERITAGEAM